MGCPKNEVPSKCSDGKERYFLGDRLLFVRIAVFVLQTGSPCAGPASFGEPAPRRPLAARQPPGTRHLLFGRSHKLTFQPRNADNEGSQNRRDINEHWRETTKSAGDDGVEDQYAIRALQDASEDRSSCIAPLLLVNKSTKGPCQNWYRRKQATPLRPESGCRKSDQKNHPCCGENTCRQVPSRIMDPKFRRSFVWRAD